MPGYLDMINSPADLKRLHMDQLLVLAGELRQRIIDVCAKSGGHLASSLGAVELVLAMHRVFNAPEDKIVWDVGHQAYAHKLVTGRKDRFHTIRQYQGLCGFTTPEESEYDTFVAGHSGPAISAALGMAKARDVLGRADQKVIAVIGDATLTGGLAFEGLNNAGHSVKNFLVILNDNKMSIAPNVGAISQYLNRIITSNFYNRMVQKAEGALEKMPLGPQLLKATHKVEEGIKHMLVPGGLFEEMGFRYFGPVDGHDLPGLIRTLEKVKEISQPVILHALTTKGKGYSFSEKDPQTYHGTPSFNTENGEMKKDNTPSYTNTFVSELMAIAETNDRVVAITAAMPDGTGLSKFAQRFPSRLFDVGIAEAHAVSFAAGLATQGVRPVVAIYSTFLQRAVDQIIHDVCLQNLPVTFCMDRAGVAGEDGATHQGAFDIGYLRNVPNLVLMQPKDGQELRYMLRLAIDHKGPAAIRYPKGKCIPMPGFEALKPFNIGEGEVLREGRDGQFVVLGNLVEVAMDVAKRFAAEGIELGVVNARFVKPLDKALLKRVLADAPCIITMEEGALQGGFGSAVLEFLQEESIACDKVQRIGFPDRFVHHGNRNVLLQSLGLDADSVYQTLKSGLLSRKASGQADASNRISEKIISINRA